MRFGYAHNGQSSLPAQLALFDQPTLNDASWGADSLRSIDLFAGAGGLSLGLEKAGFEPLLLNEINADAARTLSINRPNWNVVCADISEVDFTPYADRVDLLCGGPPCQSYSRAGKQMGDLDSRGQMYLQFLRAIEEVRPKAVLFENVVGLKNWDAGRVVNEIVSDLQAKGYQVKGPVVLNANDYGVAQVRKRLFIVAIRKDIESDGFHFPKPSDYKPCVRDAFFAGTLYDTDLPESSEGYAYSAAVAERMRLVPAGGNWKDLPEVHARAAMGVLYGKPGSTGVCHRLRLDKPSRTLVHSPVSRMTFRGHPTENRPLNVAEYASLQGFSRDYQFAGAISSKYRQIGNAVAVGQAAALGYSIRDCLKKNIRDF